MLTIAEEKLLNNNNIFKHKTNNEIIGKGSFGTVFIGYNKDNSKMYGVKKIKKHLVNTYSIDNEVNVLLYINKMCNTNLIDKSNINVIELINDIKKDDIRFLVFPLYGYNLYEYQRLIRFSPIPISICKIIAKDIIDGIDFLHNKCQLIHRDLKLENIVFKNYTEEVSKKNCNIVIIDLGWAMFKDGAKCQAEKVDVNANANANADVNANANANGNADGDSNALDKELLINKYNVVQSSTEGYYLQSRYYRAPELIFKISKGCHMDIWSIGCVLYEIITGKPLFGVRKSTNNIKLFQRIIRVCGIPDYKFITEYKIYDYFTSKGDIIIKYDSEGIGIVPFSDKIIPDISSKDFILYYNIISQCLELDFRKRVPIEELVRHSLFI